MSGVFDVHSFYKLLSSSTTDASPWECIWRTKVAKRVSFFLWTTANDGESMDHLLLHCKFSHALWCKVFAMFGIQ